MDFINYQPVKLIFGENKIDEIDQVVAQYGQRVFIIGPIMCEAIKHLFTRLESVLTDANIQFHTFYEVESNPSIQTVDNALKKAREIKPDVIIGIGGGSVIDVSKICSILYANPKYSWDFLFNTFNDFRSCYKSIEGKLPLIVVPTTSGTGSQCTQACVLTDKDLMKKTIFHQQLFADVAILDPTLVLSLPPRMTKATAFDALSHSLESFLRSDHPICTLLAKEGIAKIVHYLPKVLQDNKIQYREQLMLADTLGGISLSNCGAMLPHPLSEIIGSYTGICHGEALALVYPAFLKHTAQKYQIKYANLARYLFPSREFKDDTVATDVFIQTILDMMKECSFQPKLSNYNISSGTLQKIYQFIADLHLPMESEETIQKILNQIFEK